MQKTVKPSNSRDKGFTLIELLVVVAIIAVMASIAAAAVDPAQRFSDTRNARRVTDINAIMDAVQLYNVDNGSFPAAITATSTEICRSE